MGDLISLSPAAARGASRDSPSGVAPEGGGGAGDHQAGAEPALHLDRADLGRFPQQLRQPADVLELDGLDPGDLLQQLGELLHFLGCHTRAGCLLVNGVCYTSSSSSVRASERTTAPSAPRYTSSSRRTPPQPGR